MKKSIDTITIRDYETIMHVNFGDTHAHKHKGFFVCEGKPLHGKEFFHEMHTKTKGFGEQCEATNHFYLNEQKAPVFDTIEKLVEHYHSDEKQIQKVKELIEKGLIKEVITKTNGKRKTVILLKDGKELKYEGETAKKIIMLTNKN